MTNVYKIPQKFTQIYTKNNRKSKFNICEKNRYLCSLSENVGFTFDDTLNYLDIIRHKELLPDIEDEKEDEIFLMRKNGLTYEEIGSKINLTPFEVYFCIHLPNIHRDSFKEKKEFLNLKSREKYSLSQITEYLGLPEDKIKDFIRYERMSKYYPGNSDIIKIQGQNFITCAGLKNILKQRKQGVPIYIISRRMKLDPDLICFNIILDVISDILMDEKINNFTEDCADEYVDLFWKKRYEIIGIDEVEENKIFDLKIKGCSDLEIHEKIGLDIDKIKKYFILRNCTMKFGKSLSEQICTRKCCSNTSAISQRIKNNEILDFKSIREIDNSLLISFDNNCEFVEHVLKENLLHPTLDLKKFLPGTLRFKQFTKRMINIKNILHLYPQIEKYSNIEEIISGLENGENMDELFRESKIYKKPRRRIQQIFSNKIS